MHFALCIFWISEGKLQPLNAVSCQTWLIRYVFFQLEGLLIRFPDPPWVRDPDYSTSIIGPGKNFKRCISNVQYLTSRVTQLTCIWMSGASGLGNLTTFNRLWYIVHFDNATSLLPIKIKYLNWQNHNLKCSIYAGYITSCAPHTQAKYLMAKVFNY